MASFWFSSIGLCQEPDLKRTISVSYVNESLESVLNDLSQTQKVEFSYNPKKIPKDLKINYSANEVSIEKVLTEILTQAGLRFEVVKGYIILKEKSGETEVPVYKPPKPEMFTISGTIMDSTNREFLIGAAVFIRENGAVSLTNNYGFFSLTLPKGNYELEVSNVGYAIEKRVVELMRNISLAVNLKPIASMLEEIVITAENKEEIIFSSLAAQYNLKPVDVQKQTAVLGETDMIKTLDYIPGISFQSEGSSYFSVRGGNRDQNLILLDEATIYNPTHLLGLFTPIIPEAVKHTEVYKADFPVEYGGRLSSVTDIRTRDGNMQQVAGNISVGMVSTRASIEGPFKKNASSYFVSLRRSNFGFIIKKVSPTIKDFHFTDFTAKFNLKAGDKNRLFITLFSGKDSYINQPGTTKNGLIWKNNSFTFRWNHIFGPKLFLNTTLYTSKFDYSLYTNYDEGICWNSHISSNNLKSEFTYFMDTRNKLKFGINLGGYFFNPGNYNSGDSAANNLRVSKVNSGELILYAGNEYKLSEKVLINYGLRLSGWSNYGEGFSVQYDKNYQPLGYTTYEKGEKYYSKRFLEPRISVSVKTSKFAALKASYNRNIQHINLINNSISPFNSLEVWLPSGPNINPQYAHMLDLGYVQTIPTLKLDISADIFYKKMFNQIGYSAHAETILNPFLEGELRQGNGEAYGVEVGVKRTIGKITGAMAYTYTRSFLQINGLNANKKYKSHYDKPVDFSFTLDYKTSARTSLNMAFVYTSGMPYTTPTGFYTYRGAQVPWYSSQNNDRLPDYKRVDVGFVWRLNKAEESFEHFLTFSVYNFFAIKNYAFLNFNKTPGDDGTYYVPADKTNVSEQLVTYRYIYSFIPSITYNLKF